MTLTTLLPGSTEGLMGLREELNKEFFKDLKKWVGELSKVQFEGDEKTKLELIITLINKFIFIQTLDDHGVIKFNWIKRT